MADEDKILIYEQYGELLDGIFYYHDQQVELREMCLKIMLGTFTLVGGLLFVKIDLTSYQFLLLAALLPILALIFVTVNLANDLIYKERMKLSFVSEAIRLEKSFHWLPQFHLALFEHKKIADANGKGPLVFYLVSCGILTFLSAVSISLIPGFCNILSFSIILFCYSLFYFIYCCFIVNSVRKTSQILELLKNE